MFEQQVLEAMRRLLGEGHPDTTISAWNLSLTLRDGGDSEAVAALFKRNLLWLAARDPATLSADQRKIRDMLADVL